MSAIRQVRLSSEFHGSNKACLVLLSPRLLSLHLFQATNVKHQLASFTPKPKSDVSPKPNLHDHGVCDNKTCTWNFPFMLCSVFPGFQTLTTS